MELVSPVLELLDGYANNDTQRFLWLLTLEAQTYGECLFR